MEDTSNITGRLVKDYLNFRDQVTATKRQLSRAEINLLNAANELGKHLVPKDAKVGETFSIWVRVTDKEEALLNITVAEHGDFILSWR